MVQCRPPLKESVILKSLRDLFINFIRGSGLGRYYVTLLGSRHVMIIRLHTESTQLEAHITVCAIPNIPEPYKQNVSAFYTRHTYLNLLSYIKITAVPETGVI